MKHIRKLICIGLFAALLIPMLVSCNSEEKSEAATDLILAADGASEYVLVYPADASQADMELYNDFSQQLREITWYFFPMKSDSEPAEEGAKEILLGKTNRPASIQAYDKLEADQIGVFVIDEQVAILSNFQGGFEYAADEFFKRVGNEKTVKVASDLAIRIQCEMGWEANRSLTFVTSAVTIRGW